MPRILRITNRFNLGGPTYNVAYLSKYLAPDFETMLVGGMKDESEEGSEFIVENLGLTPVIIPEMKRAIDPKNDYLAYKKLKQIIQDFKPDIVHTHASKAGTLGRLAAASCKVPVVYHTFHGHVFHSYFGKAKTLFYKNVERYLATKSTQIIAISDIQKHELVNEHKICNASKVLVIPLGFDLQKFQDNIPEKRKSFRTHYHISDNEIVISIIGRLVPIKNHNLFLEALKFVLENTNKKVRAMIVGDGEDRKSIEAKATELGIPFSEGNDSENKTTITFTSWIKEIDWVCAGSDIIALTSFNEGTPVSLIEAQAANKPIVSTNVGGIENVVIPNKTALLSENNVMKAFAENLLKVVNNDTLRASMGESGWEHVKQKFHFTRLVSDMKTSYIQSLAAYRG